MEQIIRTSRQIGAAIRRHRRALQLRQADVGVQTKLRQATISALENGESDTRLSTLVDVMAVLGLELVVRERTKANKDIEDLF